MCVCGGGGVRNKVVKYMYMRGAPESPLSTGPERPRYATDSKTCKEVKSCNKHGRPDQSQRELTVALRGVEWVHGLFLFPPLF